MTDESFRAVTTYARWKPVTCLLLPGENAYKPRLMRVPGVANAAIWGDRWHVKQALVDPDLMKKHNVSMQQVLHALFSLALLALGGLLLRPAR